MTDITAVIVAVAPSIEITRIEIKGNQEFLKDKIRAFKINGINPKPNFLSWVYSFICISINDTHFGPFSYELEILLKFQ
jgi:hypothetical protein